MVRRDITNDVTLSFSSGVGKNRNETKMAAPISIDIEIGNDEKSFFGETEMKAEFMLNTKTLSLDYFLPLSCV